MKIAGLDGLRALAVISVFAFHDGLFPAGWVGVQIFFVISGFLITRILVADKDQSLRRYLKNFYGRRLLRIFPLYYAYLIVVWIGCEVILQLRPEASDVFVEQGLFGFMAFVLDVDKESIGIGGDPEFASLACAAVISVVPGTRLDRNTAANGTQLRSVSRSGWSCSC
jgi:surface polysaccharide O-acyltransferase-like enzyme